MRKALWAIALTAGIAYAQPCATSYPQALLCTGAQMDDSPWDKELAPGVTLYGKRIDWGLEGFKLRYNHISYIPALNIAADTRLKVGLVALDIKVLIDENADRTIDKKVMINATNGNAKDFFNKDLPKLIEDARKDPDPLNYFYRELAKYTKDTTVKFQDVTDEDRDEFSRHLQMLEDQMKK